MSFRVMTYNILNGGETREAYLLDVIQTVRPDVLLLQEVFTADILKSWSHTLGLQYYLGAGNGKRKVALLSKYPVLSFRSHHPRFPIWRNYIEAEIEYDRGKRVRVIGVHPIANLGILFEIWRLWEAKYIVGHLPSLENAPLLLAGDFNAIAPGDKAEIEKMPNWLKWIIYLQGNCVYHYSIKMYLSTGLIDCFRALHAEDGFTLPPPDPNSRLDYIFVNATMRTHLHGCWVVREPASVDRASDHYPVVAEFDL